MSLWKIMAFFDVMVFHFCSDFKLEIIVWGPGGSKNEIQNLRRNLYFWSPGRGTFFSRLGAGALARPSRVTQETRGHYQFPGGILY